MPPRPKLPIEQAAYRLAQLMMQAPVKAAPPTRPPPARSQRAASLSPSARRCTVSRPTILLNMPSVS